MAAVGFIERATAVRWAVRRLIRSGACTERGAAARCAISQPHMHHWLACRRSLSMARLDQVIVCLRLDLAAVEAEWVEDGGRDAAGA